MTYFDVGYPYPTHPFPTWTYSEEPVNDFPAHFWEIVERSIKDRSMTKSPSNDNPINEIFEDDENGQVVLIDWTNTYLDSHVIGFRYIGFSSTGEDFFYIDSEEEFVMDDYQFFQEYSYLGFLDEHENLVFEDDEEEPIHKELEKIVADEFFKIREQEHDDAYADLVADLVKEMRNDLGFRVGDVFVCERPLDHYEPGDYLFIHAVDYYDSIDGGGRTTVFSDCGVKGLNIFDLDDVFMAEDHELKKNFRLLPDDEAEAMWSRLEVEYAAYGWGR